MKIRYCFLIFLIITVGCGNHYENCKQVKSEQVEQTVIAFLNAANNSDFEKLKSITTSDFRMFISRGEESFDDLVEFISDFPEPDKYDFNKFNFNILRDCNSAFVNYLYGPTNMLNNSSIPKDNYSHGIYLIRRENELKVHFLYSSPIKN